jgi:hypothetical protein
LAAGRRRRILLGDGDRRHDDHGCCRRQGRESPVHGRQRTPVSVQVGGHPGDTGGVGYNPYRRFRARPVDYALVAVCLLVAVALLVWAVAG